MGGGGGVLVVGEVKVKGGATHRDVGPLHRRGWSVMMWTRKTWPLSAVGSSEGTMPPQDRTGSEEEERRFDGLHTRSAFRDGGWLRCV